MTDLMPVPHPHYCVHGVQIGWHLAVDPQTVIDHRFCAPCKRCVEGVQPEKTTTLPPMTEHDLLQLHAGLLSRILHIEDAIAERDTPMLQDNLTAAKALLRQVKEAREAVNR